MLFRSLLTCFLVFCVTWSGSLRAQALAPVKSQRYAFLVGINDYTTPLNKLEYCKNDITALRAHLVAAGFDPENITLMHDKAEEARFCPTKSAIEGELKGCMELANPEDVVFVAFSGHGLQVEGKSYLCPSDARVDATSSLLAIEDIYKLMAQSQAGQKLLVLDACRNEPIVRGYKGKLKDDLTIQLGAPPKGIIALFSCQPGQFSAEDAKIKHGVFMHYLMEGLKGRADDKNRSGDGNGLTALHELYTYVELETKRHVYKSHNFAQKPAWMGDKTTGFDLGNVPESSKLENLKTLESREVAVSHSSETKQALVLPKLDNPLLKTANSYLESGKHENAISAYTAIIDNTANSSEIRAEARKNRGAAYLARGTRADLDKALIDQQAAGEKGILLTIRAASADLRGYPDKTVGKLKQSQAVVVTSIKDDWLWVASVDGSDALKGYIKAEAVLAQVAAPAPRPQTYQLQYTQEWQPQRNNRAPSIWETPEWESPAEIRRGRANGTLR